MRGGYTGLENLFRKQNVEGRIGQGISEVRANTVPDAKVEREYIKIQGRLGYFDEEGNFRPVVQEELDSWK